MQTSFLLCFVSKQRLEGYLVLETKLPCVSSRVASVVGNKAGHIFVTGNVHLSPVYSNKGQWGVQIWSQTTSCCFLCLSSVPLASQSVLFQPDSFKILCWFSWKNSLQVVSMLQNIYITMLKSQVQVQYISPRSALLNLANDLANIFLPYLQMSCTVLSSLK